MLILYTQTLRVGQIFVDNDMTISVLIFIVMVIVILIVLAALLFQDAYARFVNDRLCTRIGVLYQMGMNESAYILKVQLLNYWWEVLR